MDASDYRRRAAERANDRLLMAAQELEVRGDERVVFLCECRDALCAEYVRLTLAEHEAQRRGHGFILYPGHEPLADAPMMGELREFRD